ncbi:MAG: DUF1349 domain-containing protein [Acidimicrobiia bacterium]
MATASAEPDLAVEAQAGTEGPYSDDFVGPTIDGMWTYSDPGGDVVQTMVPAGVSLAIPGGSDNDIVVAGSDTAPRLLQSVVDSDFQVTAKFAAVPTEGVQIEGILIRQDASNWVRYVIYNAGSTFGTNVNVVVNANGTTAADLTDQVTPPGSSAVWLRVVRTGDFYSFSHSFDGTTFTALTHGAQNLGGLTVDEIGVYAATSVLSGPAPAFTAVVDSFTTTTTPTLSGLSATPTATGATVSWTTSNPASSSVGYGTTAALGQTATGAGGSSSHVVTLSGLACATTYSYQATSTDAANLSVSSAISTFTTSACPSGGLTGPAVGLATAPSGGGYWQVASDGSVAAAGGAPYFGSMGGIPLNLPVVGIAATPTGQGYWLVASDGGIFSFGDARFFGSTGNIVLNKPIVGMASTPSGNGYWLVATDGGIFAYGDAAFFGSTGDIVLNKPVVGMDTTPSGNGYWLVATDGGIFAFGDAAFFGSTGNIVLNKPIVGMAATLSGNGYWFVATDGGIFAYGDATFHGSTANQTLPNPIAGLAPLPSGNGYRLVGTGGEVYTFGS